MRAIREKGAWNALSSAVKDASQMLKKEGKGLPRETRSLPGREGRATRTQVDGLSC